MPKSLLVSARKETPEEPLSEVDAAGLASALSMVIGFWREGAPCPGSSLNFEKTLVQDQDGQTVGYNYYLTVDEPQRLGSLRTETDVPAAATLSAATARAVAEGARRAKDPFHGMRKTDPGHAKRLSELLADSILAGIAERSGEGKRSLMTDLFNNVPGVLLNEEIQEEVADTVAETLIGHGFQPHWDTRDGHFVLQVRW